MKTITQEIINKALENDIVAIIKSKGIDLKKVGNEYKTNCPFPDHEDKTPSFFVNPEKQLFQCFGCGRKGNIINFLTEYSHYTFQDSIKYLLEQNGNIHLLESSKVEKLKSSDNFQTLKPSNLQTNILNRVADFYHRTFKNSPEAIEYLSETRKIKSSAIYNAYKIGYSNGTLLNTLSNDSATKKELLKIGIIKINENTKQEYELFKNCIMFPMLDENNNCVGMYGRKINQLESLKVERLKSSDNLQTFEPSNILTKQENEVRHLYLPGPRRGIFNRNAVKQNKTIILTESIIDALSAIVNGWTNIIPIYGVNGLTKEHINLFKENLVEKIIFCMDNDKEGNDTIPKLVNRLKDLPITFDKIILSANTDLNDFFKTHQSDDFKKLLDTAEPIKLLAEKKSKSYAIDINGDEITFNAGDIVYTVRGLNLYGFSRMKVNLRARKNTEFHIDTIDLYASKSRTGFINQCSKRFECDISALEKDIFYLIKELEKIRDTTIKDQDTDNKNIISEMTESEKLEGLTFLKSKNLINEILKDMETLGYVGEETNKIMSYLVSVSRKLPDPLACIIISRSGAGKSNVLERIEILTPPEDLIQFSNLTSQALFYMEKNELKHKLLLIEDKAGSEQADYSIRELQSKKVLRKGVPIKDPLTGKIKTQRLEVNGPIAFMESTTKLDLNHENLNRCFILYIDESSKQTIKIQEYQRRSKTREAMKNKLLVPHIIRKHHNAQRLLKTVRVFNQFSELITFPNDRLRTRRDNFRFLNLIEAVTFLHQYQRGFKTMVDELTGEIIEYIESTIEDYTIAYDIIKKILDVTIDEIPKSSKDLLLIIHDYTKANFPEAKTTDIKFTRREIREFSKWSNDQIKNHFKKLEEMEYLYTEKGARGQQNIYQLYDEKLEIESLIEQIPTPEKILIKLKNLKV